MSGLLQWIEAKPVLASILVALVPLLFPQVRSFFGTVWKLGRLPFTLPAVLDTLTQGLSRLEEGHKRVLKEVLPNGGSSLKDSNLRIESMVSAMRKEQQQDFWEMDRPMIKLDGRGHLLEASEACCRLFRVADTDELTGFSWRRFLDSSRVVDMLASFREAAEADSAWRYATPIFSLDREARGEWEIRATLLDRAGEKLYRARLVPVDAEAHAICERAGWRK